MQFNLNSPGVAVTDLEHKHGTYVMKQFHMHWGRKTGEGSEHRINGLQHEVEIHFVHIKEGPANASQRDYITVVAVFGEIDEKAELSGPWLQLNASRIQKHGAHYEIPHFHLAGLLPKNKNYYHYEGSLTTPPCSETVLWFVLKEPIRIPGAFLDQLRKVEDTHGFANQANFRKPQDLAGRIVLANKLNRMCTCEDY